MTYEQVHDHDSDNTDEREDRERLLCTEKELEKAGFTVGDLTDMPETDPEFVPDPMDRLASGTERRRQTRRDTARANSAQLALI